LRVLFELHRALEHLLHIGLAARTARVRPTTLNWRGAAVDIEVEGKLLGDGIDQRAAVAEGEPRAAPTALASISGLRMPAALRMASTDSRMLLAVMRVARSVRRVRSWARSSKE
jgi:hypothetical protein